MHNKKKNVEYKNLQQYDFRFRLIIYRDRYFHVIFKRIPDTVKEKKSFSIKYI